MKVSHLARLSLAVHHAASTRRVLTFALLQAVFMLGVMPWTGARLQALGQGAGPLDVRFFATAQATWETVDSYGALGRAFYSTVQCTLDVAYPLVYGLFLALLLSWLGRRAWPPGSRLQRANLLPLLAACFDLLENAGIVALLNFHPGRLDALAWATTGFTMAKWLAVAVCLALVLWGALRAWRGR